MKIHRERCHHKDEPGEHTGDFRCRCFCTCPEEIPGRLADAVDAIFLAEEDECKACTEKGMAGLMHTCGNYR